MLDLTSLAWLAEAADFVWSLARVALLAGALIVLAATVVRAWRRSRMTEIVISTLADGTGDPVAGAAALGLTYRLREEVLSALPQLADHAIKTVERAAKDSTSPLQSLALDDIARESLLRDISSSQRELTESMESLVPEKARGAYRVVANTLFQPKEVQVSGVLQRRDDRPGGLGISFTVLHVGSEEAASRITLWEDEPSETATATKALASRFHELVGPASRSLACELLRQRLLGRPQKPRLRARLAVRKGNRHVRTPNAVVEFLVGAAYQSDAHHNAPATKSFYELAARALAKSLRKLDHYSVSFQLASTLGELARRQGADIDEAITLLRRSTRGFEDATRKLPRADLPQSERRAEALKLRAALTLNACLEAELLPDDVERAAKGAAAAAELMEAKPGEYENVAVLYSVACALAVAARVHGFAAHGLDLDACRSHAERWLLHACADRDRWWKKAEADPDLRLLHDWMAPTRRRLQESISGRDGEKPLDSQSIGPLVDGVVMATATTLPSRANSLPTSGSDSTQLGAQRAQDPVGSE